jgi:hypothetical protein
MNREPIRPSTSQEPAEGSPDIPPPEQGSPGGDSDHVSDDQAETVEKGHDPDANPLAPPTNTQAGS